MHWKSWLPRARRRCVLGVDVGLRSCRLVVLSGSRTQPDMVCAAEQLQFPEDAWVAQGHVWCSTELGRWLRQHVQQSDYDVDGMYMCIDDACISHHSISLSSELTEDDVTFQVLAEVQALLGVSAADLSVDYGLEMPLQSVVQEERDHGLVYRAAAAPRFQVDALLRVAKAAQIKLFAVEGRGEAIRRTQSNEILRTLPTAGVAMALQCEAAFGLALGGWGSRTFNFLPHRALTNLALRRAWWLGVVACVVSGAFLATGFALAIAASTTATLNALPDRVGIAAAYQSVQLAHASAQAIQHQTLQQQQWLHTQNTLQLQNLQWAQVLGQSGPGVWVVRVDQQGERWTVRGEALTSAHALQVLQQLKALPIWVKSPEMSQLQEKPSSVNAVLPIWQFRIEAELKGVV